MKKIVSLAALAALLAACTTGTNTTGGYGTDGFGEETLNTGVGVDTSLNTAYLMAPAPKYYIGSPYKVEDVQYIPAEDFAYNQTGVAGIIPTELNGTKTSNGETFDVNQFVATSKTLPLPTIARVTNLDNGQSVVVRINNRGPFVNTRIMDLSPAAARQIGMNGQSRVQIQVMAEQTQAVKNATLGATMASTPVVTETVTSTEYTPAPQPAPEQMAQPAATAGGEYSVQLAALYSEDSANSMAARMRTFGNAVVVKEGDLYKVRIVDLNASQARYVIDTLRSSEGLAPGLLKNGRWINADSI